MRLRQATVVFAACMLIGVPVAAQAPGQAPNQAQVARARAAAKELGQKLKSQLVAAIQSGGPQAAIGVCRTIAPALSQDIGAESAMKVGRTALRVRNPANAPDDWERTVLEEFAAKIKAGADPARLERAETFADASGANTFRYMKAIPMAAKPCLTCHGVPEPSLKAEIERLYPQDQATGFKLGELRGAFTVTAPAQ